MSTSIYHWPASIPESGDFKVSVNGQPVFVHDTNCAAFAIFSFSGGAQISVETARPIPSATVRPKKWNTPAINGSTLTLQLDAPAKLSVEIAELKPLFLFCSAPETEVPDCRDPAVRFFPAGQIHDAGEISLRSGETLYIEGGAVVRGMIRAKDANHAKVMGRGILDGGFSKGAAKGRLAAFDTCNDLRVEGITMIDPASWMLVLGACDGVVVRDIKQVGEVMCSDGIDIVGSRNVLVEDCFFRNNDDAIAVKAMDFNAYSKLAHHDWSRDVRNVLVLRCVFLNAESGNVMEIGYETRTESISDITFRDCDVIAAHGGGGVFTIHLGDRAAVSNVTYEDIRVEHFYTKLIDFRIFRSRYSKDPERGRIRNITLRKIRTNPDIFNTPSLIGGFDAAHTIEGVVIEDFFIGDKKITNPDDLHLFSNHAAGIVFR